MKFFASRITDALRTFDPIHFTMVMATGVVSIACRQQGMNDFPLLLLNLNEVLYVSLWMILLFRFLFSGRSLRNSLNAFTGTPGTFSIVAATCVLGTQYRVLSDDFRIAAFLWYPGFFLWLVLMYAFLARVIAGKAKPENMHRVSGEWLLVVVSTQSVSVLGSLLAPYIPAGGATFLFISLCIFFVGSILYVIVITAILYRLLFSALSPCDLTPAYWITMGGAAISTLAGATLISGSYHWRFLGKLAPILTGGSLFFWAVGSWWIPLLLILGAWSHLRMRSPLVGASAYWSMVFPLGMYSVCSYQLAYVTALPFFNAISRFFSYAALLAWLATCAAVLCSMIPYVRRRKGRE